MTRALCSCGRDEVELGCDLCRYCRADFEEREMHRAMEAAYTAEQQAQYEDWVREVME